MSAQATGNIILIRRREYLRERVLCPICKGTKYAPTNSVELREAGLDNAPCHFCDIDGYYIRLTPVLNCVNCDD